MIKPKKLPQESVALLLPRLKDEYNAFYLYRAAANWCQGVSFFKAADFFRKESETELEHAKIIEAYLTGWNVIPDLPDIKKPETAFKGLSDIIDKAYQTEYALYEEYEDTSMKAFKVDVCTFDFLQQFRTIQRESVEEYSDMLNMLEGVDTADKFKMLELEKKIFS